MSEPNSIHCPEVLPSKLGKQIRKLGIEWASSNAYPRIDPEVCAQWDALLEQWANDKFIPLLIRRSSEIRGKKICHKHTEWSLVPCDNSPAQWACFLALQGQVPTLKAVRHGFDQDKIPIMYARKAAESSKRRFHCTLGRYSINKCGWKLCHISEVGFGSKIQLAEHPIENLREKFKLLMSPKNFVLVPKGWGGLGEVDEFLDGVIEGVKKRVNW